MQRTIHSRVLAAAVSSVFVVGIVFPLSPSTALSQPTTAPATPATKPTDVPVRAISLFSSGVGYFEHSGSVAGDGSTQLRFKTDQINDILKSLIVQDLDGGNVTTINYPSQDPIERTLKSFQVDITGNPPLADLLNQLRGAKVTVTASGEKAVGIILGVETRQKPADEKTGGVITTHVLNLIAGGKITAIQMDLVSGIELDDPQLQDELNRALVALASARDQDKKPVTINFTGQGEHRIRLGYVVATPIWKTSYRLILPGGGADTKPKMQGWAIVENQTDNDWTNVQLSLVSGRPISFVQDLYQSLYIQRPVVEPELFASLRPRVYEGGIADRARNELSDAAPRRPAAPAPSLARRQGGAGGGGAAGGFAPRDTEMAKSLSLAAESDAPINAAASVRSVASASQVGELFQYTVGNVSLPRQKSAMIPIVTDDIELERMSIYNASVLPRNPLNGARLKNTTGKHLLQGPVTVLDGSTYAGDAQIDNVPPGQERLLSYGVDQQMVVDPNTNRNESAIQSAKIVKGVLSLTRKNVFTQEYVSENKSDKDKTLVIEHPIRQGWKLVDTDKPIETTAGFYRFKTSVPAGKGGKFVVKQETVGLEVIAMNDGNFAGRIDAFLSYSRQGEISPKVREALTRAIQLWQAVRETEQQAALKAQAVQEITNEQNRIRQNMSTVNQQSQYYNRLLTKLNDQETDIEKLRKEQEELAEKLKGQQKELSDYLNQLTVE